jgi:hypothetical protein
LPADRVLNVRFGVEGVSPWMPASAPFWALTISSNRDMNIAPPAVTAAAFRNSRRLMLPSLLNVSWGPTPTTCAFAAFGGSALLAALDLLSAARVAELIPNP